MNGIRAMQYGKYVSYDTAEVSTLHPTDLSLPHTYSGTLSYFALYRFATRYNDPIQQRPQAEAHCSASPARRQLGSCACVHIRTARLSAAIGYP